MSLQTILNNGVATLTDDARPQLSADGECLCLVVVRVARRYETKKRGQSSLEVCLPKGGNNMWDLLKRATGVPSNPRAEQFP